MTSKEIRRVQVNVWMQCLNMFYMYYDKNKDEYERKIIRQVRNLNKKINKNDKCDKCVIGIDFDKGDYIYDGDKNNNTHFFKYCPICGSAIPD